MRGIISSTRRANSDYLY